MKRKTLLTITLVIILFIILRVIYRSIAFERDYVYRYIENEEYVLKKNILYAVTTQNTNNLSESVAEILNSRKAGINTHLVNLEPYEITEIYIKECDSEKIVFMTTDRECAPNKFTDKILASFNINAKRESREIGVLYCSSKEALFKYVKEQIKYHQINLLPVDEDFYIYEIVGFV